MLMGTASLWTKPHRKERMTPWLVACRGTPRTAQRTFTNGAEMVSTWFQITQRALVRRST